MKQTSLESDSFKFHIRALIKQGYIRKTPAGLYVLTPIGKELANNLDDAGLHKLRQPKLSLLIVLSRKNTDGQREYLVQQRLRQPFYGYWGCISGPTQWGVDFEETAQAELAKQSGISDVQCNVHSFYRQEDYNEKNDLLEDKLFIVITATTQEEKVSKWAYGQSKWMTFAEFSAQAKTFEASTKILSLIDDQTALKSPMISGRTTYSQSNY